MNDRARHNISSGARRRVTLSGRKMPQSLSPLRWWGILRRLALVGLPWFWPAHPRGQHAMVRARRLVRWHFGRDHDPMRRKLAQVFVTIAWPLGVLINLTEARTLVGPETSKRVSGALWAAIRHNIFPTEYFAYGLWQRDRRMNADNYLYASECTRLFKVLNRPSQPNPIDDKLAFHEMCRTHAIPTPAILAVFAPTGRLVDFESEEPPKHDLFVKVSTGGSRPERLQWRGGEFESNRGRRVRSEDLGGYLADRARTESITLLVQPVVSNHPDLHVPSSAALAAARLVTGRSIDGEVTAIFCVIYFGQGDEITSHSNCVALIDVANGRVMPAPPPNWPGVSMYRYAQLNGNDASALPDWDVALHYVRTAHQACPDFVYVGWDVAFTPHGPIVLEGNTNWEAATYQTLRGEPLGHTKFADILAERLPFD